LEEICEQLKMAREEGHSVQEAMNRLILTLRDHKLSVDDARWQECIGLCRRHPLASLLHEDPFTYRAFSKPRGYAGDAVLMDYIYGREDDLPVPVATALGQKIFEYTTRSPAPEGVRARRGFMADLLDNLAGAVDYPHVLSIAAGHLREAELSAAVRRRRLGRFVALDGDAESVQEVERAYGRFGVEVVGARIGKLLTGRLNLGEFDLVYSTGLFDYLGESAARRLTSIMFRMLRSGGRVVLANFLPGVRDIGYMEAFMDWNLVYRTRGDMMDITMEIPQEEIRNVAVFPEENHNIIFLDIAKQ
jgi:hypothetical protein